MHMLSMTGCVHSAYNMVTDQIMYHQSVHSDDVACVAQPSLIRRFRGLQSGLVPHVWTQRSLQRCRGGLQERGNIRPLRRVSTQQRRHGRSEGPEASQTRPPGFLPHQPPVASQLLQHLHTPPQPSAPHNPQHTSSARVFVALALLPATPTSSLSHINRQNLRCRTGPTSPVAHLRICNQ